MASDPPQQPEHAHDDDNPAATHDVQPVDGNQTLGIKEEEETSAQNGDGDDGIQASRPTKRRKLESLTPRRSLSRAASPPWKSFAADGPTTVFDNGVRKSSRVNREAPTPPEPLIKKSSRIGVAKGTQTNGTSKSSSKQSSRAVSIAATSAKAKTSSATKKKAPAPPLQSPTRKSERNKKASAATLATSPLSPALAKASPESTRKRPGRARKSTLISTDDAVQLFDLAEDPQNTYDDQWNSVDMSNSTNSAAPRIRLRFRRLTPPTRHPHHLPPARKHASFAEWLHHDDALEGEEGHKITEEKAKEEAYRRLQIADAAERGVLSLGRCSVFQPEPADEPPPKYRHWDHVVNHALTFNKLLREENSYHRKMAKTLAREAHEYWKDKYKRKSQDEIDQEEADRTLLRYKQLVKDVKDTWANVRVEIDKERVAKWEAEQVQLGHKAMDDMFNQAQEILGRTVVDSASSFVSDDRDTEGEGGDFGSGTSQVSGEEDVDHQMTSDSESDEGHDDDEDANLTAEQLRAKYEQLPDLPDNNSSVDDEQEVGEDEDEDKAMDDDRGTPEPTPDPDLQTEMHIEMENGDEPPDDPFTHANGFHGEDVNGDEKKSDYIDPATVELDAVDEALLDSDDDASGSGSEEWSSDEDEDSDQVGEDDEGQSASVSELGDDDVGVMGFLTPAEIKKLKASAKTIVDDVNADNEIPVNGTHDTNGTNGIHREEEEDVKVISDTNGTTEDVDTADMGCILREDTSEAAPAPIEIDAGGFEKEDETVPEKAVLRSRSRHPSEPPRVEVPSLLRGTLREYQHDGLDWLANLYDSDTNGILADEMGLGKTIQTISVLAYVALHRQKWGPHLVVVPTSVMLNWEMEFKKFLPGFKILTYYGDIAERKRKRIGWRNTGRDMINVVITSYQLILQDAAAFKMRAWQYLVLDEAHNIKNFKSQRWQTMLNLRTERRLLLTGTPLQNNIDELWSLLYFLMPAGFAGEGRIAGLEEFTMALKNPTSQILEQGRQQLDAEAQRIVKKLHEVLRPYLLRRLKADVEKQMPGKYEHVVYCKLSKRQRQLYDGFMGRASTKEILSSGNYMSIINCLMSLRKVCNHPDLFETRAIVTSMAMSKSVAARFEIKDFLIRKRLSEGMEDKVVSLEALNLVFAHRERTSTLQARRAQQIRATRPLEDLIEVQTRRINQAAEAVPSSIQSTLAAMANRERTAVREHLRTCLKLTRARTQFLPIYGKGLIDRLTMDYESYAFGAREPDEQITRPPQPSYNNPAYGPPGMQYHQPNPFGHGPVSLPPVIGTKEGRRGRLGFRQPLHPAFASLWHQQKINAFTDMIPTLEQRAEALEPLVTRFTCVTPAVAAEELAPLTLSNTGVQLVRSSDMAYRRDPFHESRIRQSIAFPDKRLLQYDCGKLQRLATLLRDLQAGGHRALIFTQMTKVLDILEQFLNIHGHRYLRLDGATKVEQRQILTDRFNNDPRILCFILSSRSGGLGINLTGADTVIFYDLDWNPAMDKQCQDRSHRIGQTRDVHIYKFVSEYTIEANILRKSNQKRLLDDVIIQKGDFTTDTFNRVTWRDALDDGLGDEAGAAMDRVLGEKAGLLGDARVMGTVEDTEDMAAATVAQKEIVDEIHDDQVDFSESAAATPGGATRAGSELGEEMPGGVDGERLRRHVDEYMLGRFRDEYGREPYKPPTDRQRRHRKGGDVHRTHKKKRY
ncbi:swr1 complex component [Didymosphaeria variabile]|uniref:DNA helicase n=1 Tax=Didymosphaeria variabile TaxID=1932322 RepID=A0A9W9CEM6_9PLEO|nr:swr1 complex component [Didymosphaeria variabile]KAJ4358100.1 swr1 complex component [Didymosphaeria variabile]